MAAGFAVTITAGALAAAVAPGGPAGAQVPASAKSGVDSSLGNGLGRLLPSTGSAQRRVAAGPIDQQQLAIKDASGRVLVNITPQAGVAASSFRSRAEAAGLSVTSSDTSSGTLEGYVATDDVRALASTAGTGTIKMVPRPRTSTGSVTSQGVAFQGIDKVLAKGTDGKGMTVGILSDSYDTATTTTTGAPLTIHAAQDIASGDLPGKGNAKYPTPVVVLQDLPAAGGGADEGRAMAQIVHDIAPAAKLCFATAFAGELQFADNIRRLADPKGKCKADVVVDDVFYFDEPAFSDGPVARAVDAVAAQGVSYFSSAGNQGTYGAIRTPLKLIPPAKAGAGNNLDLSSVPPALIAGGLQDLDPGKATDIARTITPADGGTLGLHWDELQDPDGAKLGDPIFSASGELTATTRSIDFPFTPKAADIGKQLVVRADGVPTGSTDLVLSVKRPDGSIVGPVDTGSSPESLGLTLEQAGTYTVTVGGFGSSVGGFTVDARPIVTPSKVTTDLNLLLFSVNGEYLGSSSDDNPLTGLPVDVLGLAAGGQLQVAVAKKGTAKTPVTMVALVANSVYFNDNFDSLSPAIFGHSAAAGANSVAAYDPFRGYQPEAFTSGGGKLAYPFDANGKRLAKPVIRSKPDVASADGGNTTFFTSDTPLDPDTTPNFFGTSAAAPHAAGIAALLLQKAGGRFSLSPKQVTNRLQQTAFKHDLDPYRSSGSAGGLTLSAAGAPGREGEIVPRSLNDNRFFTLSYTGKVPLRSLTLFGQTASPTSLGQLDPPASDGIVFDPRPFTGTAPFTTQGYPFTVGNASKVPASSITPSYQVPYGTTGTFRQLRLNFTRSLPKGATVRFGVDRDIALPAVGLAPREGNSADELGGSVFLPQNSAVKGGLTFQAVRADGSVFRGTLVNKIGSGWTALDGYGVINAPAAVR